MSKLSSIRIVIALLLFGSISIWTNNVASGADPSNMILDRQWESLMLEGKSLFVADGEQLRHGGIPYQTYKGEVDRVYVSDRGIRLEDLRETSFGGLLNKGGWRLEGGLLYAATRKSGGIVELYGKSRWRVEPLFHFTIPFYSNLSPPRSARHSYEFFLLYRPTEGAAAKILTQWTVPPEDIPYDHYLRGQLDYDPETDIAAVTLTDMEDKRTVLTERVGLAQLIKDLGEK